jgi:hypothetical protein
MKERYFMRLIEKTKLASLIALLLMLTTAFPLFALPTNAHSPPWTDIPTYCYVGVVPETIGVGQQALVVFWIDWIPPTASGSYGDRWTFYVDITSPSGTNQTLGPFTSDPVGGSYTSFTPTDLGVYTIVARFPQQKLLGANPYPQPGNQYANSPYVNDTFAASSSPPTHLTVQQEQIPAYQETPLPTEYWARPINGANRQWGQITGNWLAGAAQQNGPTNNYGYGTGPESGHIMWTTPYWEGGIMDERYSDGQYYTGLSYESYGLTPPIILNGKLYYNVMTPPRYGWWALDLYTGQKLFFSNTTGPWATNRAGDGSGMYPNGQLTFGQVLNYDSPNQHGGLSYLWATNVDANGASQTTPANVWYLYDSYTGNYICSINNTQLATGTAAVGNDGSILRYNVVNYGTTSNPKFYLQVWNTTQAILDSHPEIGNWYWRWRPFLNYTHDGRLGYSLNASIPSVLGPRNAILNQTGTIQTVREGDIVIVGTSGRNDARGTVQGTLWGLNLDPSKGTIGSVRWTTTFTPPKANDAYPNSTYLVESSAPTLHAVDPEDGVFCFYERVTERRWGYSLSTGQLLWGPTVPEGEFNYYGMSSNIYDGKLLSYGYAGVLTAYDITTGNIVWNWSAPSYGLGETFYPHSPLSLGCIVDGKAYMYTTEHSPSVPLRRDAHIWCVDLTTGKQLWADACWSNGIAAADGYLVSLNLFDNQIYCYGKGPSATTVEAPKTSIELGKSLVISGMVTDISAGTAQTELTARFPNGVPAVSDDSQSAWMEYVYMKRTRPTDVTGVPVTLSVMDSNNNLRNVGNTTSNDDGFFTFNWTPDISGQYTVYATFDGSKSYWPSHAVTAFAVDSPTPTPSPQAVNTATPPTDMYVLGAAIAIIIAIALVGALLASMIRKRH